MMIDTYRSQVRFNPEKMQKVNLYDSHRMFADLYCLLPGQQQKVHAHENDDKVYMLLEGSCGCTIGDELHQMSPGAICVAPAGVSHGVRNGSDEPAVLLVMMARGA